MTNKTLSTGCGPWALSKWVLAMLVLVAPLGALATAAEPTRTEDVIYSRKFGTALTLDVFKPAQPNGLGLVLIISGGWRSSHEAINPGFAEPFLKRGYTIFAVVHGSQPKFTVPEIVADMHRAVRFIRHHADEYGVDPERLGVYGASAGGHLSLMLGTAGTAGDPDAADPVERESSRVAAVACFFPPTDFLNWGKPGNVVLGENTIPGFHAPFDFREYVDDRSRYVPVTNPEKIREIGRAVSPIDHITADDPPTLLIHGDADTLVPIQQSREMLKALEAAGVPAKLDVREGAGHGWLTIGLDLELFADWFDKHLRKADQ